MTWLADIFSEGGEAMYAVLLLGLLGGLAALVMTGLAARGRQLPAVAWLAPPALVISVGAASTAVTVRVGLRAVQTGAPHEVGPMAHVAWAWATYSGTFGLLFGALLLLATALGLGIAHAIATRHEARWTIVGPVVGAALSVFSGLVLAAWSAEAAAGLELVPIAAAVALAGLACGVAGLRRAPDDEGRRSARVRGLATLCALSAVALAGLASATAWESMLHRVMAIVASRELLEMWDRGQALVAGIGRIGAVGLFLAALATTFASAPPAQPRRPGRAVLGVGLLLALVAGSLGLADRELDRLESWTRATVHEAARDQLPTLPRRILQADAGEPELSELTAPMWRWTGAGWEVVEPRAARLPFHEGSSPVGAQTLLAAADTPARALVEEGAPAGAATLAIRTELPRPDLGPDRAEVGLEALPIELGPGAGHGPVLTVPLRSAERSGVKPRDAVGLARGQGDEPLRLRLVPDEAATVTDLVDACLASAGVARANGRELRCGVAAVGEPSPEWLEAEQAFEERIRQLLLIR